MANKYRYSTALLATIALLVSSHAQAAAPSDSLMSRDTRGFVSISDIGTLSDNWNQTQLGQLVKDESMKPFVQDMKGQLQRQLSGVRDKLGLELEHLKEVASGEIGLGMVERQEKRAAVVMTVDVTDSEEAARELLAKIDAELISRKAKKSMVDVQGVELAVYDIPEARVGGDSREAVFFIHKDILCGADSRAEAENVLDRLSATESTNSLASVGPYQQAMQRCSKEAGDLTPDIRWYVDPFGYARAVRSLSQGKTRRGKDYLKILTEQGFEAIQGAGGFVNLAVPGTFEVLHRTFVYAPPSTDETTEKYRLAMRMMNFPNGGDLRPEPMIPRKLASYRTFNVDLEQAFDNVDTLFDAVAGYDDAFKSMIEGLETDPYGPRVKVRNEFIQHLGQRLTLVTDYKVPITTKSERFMFIIEITDDQAVSKAVKKFMEADPDARMSTIDGKDVWEILEPEDDYADLQIGIEEFDPLAPAPEAKPKTMNAAQASAVCVTDGKLMIASHLDFLKQVLAEKPEDETLVAAGDYNEVELAMNRLLSGPVCARCFIRTDEAYRPTYELLRQGMMPKSKTLLGRVLNRMLTPPEDEDEGILRKQKIDGRQLPSFEMVRRYFSPGGTLVRSEDDGWLVVGAVLSKRTGQARAGSIPSARTSTIR